MKETYGFIIHYHGGEQKQIFSDTIFAPDDSLVNAYAYTCLNPKTGNAYYFQWKYADESSTEPTWCWHQTLPLTAEEKALFV